MEDLHHTSREITLTQEQLSETGVELGKKELLIHDKEEELRDINRVRKAEIKTLEQASLAMSVELESGKRTEYKDCTLVIDLETEQRVFNDPETGEVWTTGELRTGDRQRQLDFESEASNED